jgi:hypothetical protein
VSHIKEARNSAGQEVGLVVASSQVPFPVQRYRHDDVYRACDAGFGKVIGKPLPKRHSQKRLPRQLESEDQLAYRFFVLKGRRGRREEERPAFARTAAGADFSEFGELVAAFKAPVIGHDGQLGEARAVEIRMVLQTENLAAHNAVGRIDQIEQPTQKLTRCALRCSGD